MAIDSRAKRQSVAVLGMPFQAPGITPDAAEPQAWRQTAAWSYFGILAASPAGAVLFYDTGTDGDSTPLADHTPDIDVEGVGWVEDSGDWVILSNTIQASGTNPGAEAYWICSTDQNISDEFRVEMDGICNVGTIVRACIVFRMSDTDNFWIVWLRENDEVSVFKVEGGVLSGELASGAVTIDAGNTYALKIEVDGTNLDVWVDGDLLIDGYTMSSFNQTAEKIGINASTENRWDFDEFKITDLTAEEAGAVLLLRLLTEGIFLGERL